MIIVEVKAGLSEVEDEYFSTASLSYTIMIETTNHKDDTDEEEDDEVTTDIVEEEIVEEVYNNTFAGVVIDQKKQ